MSNYYLYLNWYKALYGSSPYMNDTYRPNYADLTPDDWAPDPNPRPTPPMSPECECGAKAMGYKDYTAEHSHWCPVYAPNKPKTDE